MTKPEKRVTMAMVGAPHGVRGEVRLNVFAEDPSVLSKLGPFRTEGGREVTIRSIRAQGGRLIARLDGIEDRDAAAAITGATLTLDRAQLPPIGEDETFYHADLIGLAAMLVDGSCLGRVTAVQDFGAGDLLEITLAEGGQVLVPFTKAVVPEVDVAAGRLTVDPPDGLLD